MAPLLLDSRKLVTLALLLGILLPALFFSGYFIGFWKAEALLQAGRQTLALDLPDARISVAEADAYLPKVIEPGFDRDVDAPDAADAQTTETLATVQTTTVINASVQEIQAAPPVENVQTQNIAIGGPPLQSEEDELALLADTAEEELARYSIQVGVFSTADNAERKVEDLLAQRLSAYSSEYTNQQHRKMYNVRFGYYRRYSDARTALRIYQKALSGDGYIVKLKR